MSEYPKTENMLLRDERTHKLIPGAFREEAFEQIARWHVTEKIDGTNIRLILGLPNTPYTGFSVRGRSDAAALPPGFIEEAVPGIDTKWMNAALRAIDPQEYASGMIVYGEGYGPGIQSGGDYAPHKSFRIYDVVTLAEDRPPLWRRWEDVEVVAGALGLRTAPVLRIHGNAAWTTAEIFEYVTGGVYSHVASEDNGAGFVRPAEGIVARTDPYLYTSRGERIKFKLKARDLA